MNTTKLLGDIERRLAQASNEDDKDQRRPNSSSRRRRREQSIALQTTSASAAPPHQAIGDDDKLTSSGDDNTLGFAHQSTLSVEDQWDREDSPSSWKNHCLENSGLFLSEERNGTSKKSNHDKEVFQRQAISLLNKLGVSDDDDEIPPIKSLSSEHEVGPRLSAWSEKTTVIPKLSEGPLFRTAKPFFQTVQQTLPSLDTNEARTPGLFPFDTNTKHDENEVLPALKRRLSTEPRSTNPPQPLDFETLLETALQEEEQRHYRGDIKTSYAPPVTMQQESSVTTRPFLKKGSRNPRSYVPPPSRPAVREKAERTSATAKKLSSGTGWQSTSTQVASETVGKRVSRTSTGGGAAALPPSRLSRSSILSSGKPTVAKTTVEQRGLTTTTTTTTAFHAKTRTRSVPGVSRARQDSARRSKLSTSTVSTQQPGKPSVTSTTIDTAMHERVPYFGAEEGCSKLMMRTMPPGKSSTASTALSPPVDLLDDSPQPGRKSKVKEDSLVSVFTMPDPKSVFQQSDANSYGQIKRRELERMGKSFASDYDSSSVNCMFSFGTSQLDKDVVNTETVQALAAQAQARLAVVDEEITRLRKVQETLHKQEGILKQEREAFEKERENRRLEIEAERQASLAEIKGEEEEVRRQKMNLQKDIESFEERKSSQRITEEKFCSLKLSYSKLQTESKAKEDRLKSLVEKLQEKVRLLEKKNRLLLDTLHRLDSTGSSNKNNALLDNARKRSVSVSPRFNTQNRTSGDFKELSRSHPVVSGSSFLSRNCGSSTGRAQRGASGTSSLSPKPGQPTIFKSLPPVGESSRSNRRVAPALRESGVQQDRAVTVTNGSSVFFDPHSVSSRLNRTTPPQSSLSFSSDSSRKSGSSEPTSKYAAHSQVLSTEGDAEIESTAGNAVPDEEAFDEMQSRRSKQHMGKQRKSKEELSDTILEKSPLPITEYQELLSFSPEKAWRPMELALKQLRASNAQVQSGSVKINKDGSQELAFCDGHREVLYTNGLRKALCPSGWVVIFFANGDVRGNHPLGTMYYFFSEHQIRSITNSDGKVFNSFPGGQVDCRFPSGKIQVLFPNGFLKQIDPDGKTEHIQRY